jgi:phosphoenolpyruvate synthase/pyruvate phosphate dikinase
MVDMIRSFNDLTAEQQSLGGGKGGTLARLYQAGYPVPDGFVILPTAFDGDELTAEGWAQVQAHLTRMRKADSGIAFAVRSSAMSEDAAQASFAGEFETVLDVHTDEMIREAIRTVRRSRHSERVRAYTRAKGMDIAHEIAVVVQRLVRADVSGILFTADPVSGSRACMIGNYIYGLGDELVSGEAEPYTFTLKRPKGQYDGPSDMKRFARKLYKLASRLEKELESPQDIEWCVADGKLYLLQSRPITTLVGYDSVTGVWNDSLTGDYLWVDNGGIYPEVMTPSSMSVWRVLFTMQMAGVAAMGFIGGRLYANYSFLYTLLRKFGKSDEGIRDFMEVRLGPLPEGIDIPTVPISTIGLLGDWIPLAVEMLPQQMKLKRQHQSIVASASERCRELRQRIRETNEKAGLIPLWHEEVWPLFWDLLQLLDGTNDDYFNPYVALKSELAKLLGKEDADTLLSALGGGGSGKLISVGPLVDMAKVARGEMTREAYIEQHGHREANENELAVPRPQEDPRWLDRQLAEFEQSPVDVQKLLEKSAAEFDAVWKKFEASHPKKAKKLRKKIDQFTEALHKREEVRSELTRSVGVMRHWFLRAGSLTGLGDDVFFLTYQEVLDILSGDDSATAYITIRRETYEEYSALPPYPMVIRGRFDPIQWASDPNRRTDYFDSLSPTSEAISTLRQAQDTASNTIRGVAGSAGRVEGVVRLLNSPSEGDQLRKGEILLATTTNIGWTPLFTRAAAVITDIGAPLSHAAIVARELGIPAVVGCGNATMRLRTGDRVLVDGGRGIIEILKAA